MVDAVLSELSELAALANFRQEGVFVAIEFDGETVGLEEGDEDYDDWFVEPGMKMPEVMQMAQDIAANLDVA